ncbi:MAG: NYN domain-containing protein [Lachnospiraceae bacterium]|nr:NYN domain-containing protein [Lachnospiraceae bacterium]
MKRRRQEKKKNTGVLIDGENISARKARKIMDAVNNIGVLYTAKVYCRQKDPYTKNWASRSRENGIEDIRLYGGPAKDKVDNKIKKDARNLINLHRNVDIICLVTNDGGFTDVIMDLRNVGKKVVVFGGKQAPKRLRNSCNTFIEV